MSMPVDYFIFINYFIAPCPALNLPPSPRQILALNARNLLKWEVIKVPRPGQSGERESE
jgi:hypothetical protein